MTLKRVYKLLISAIILITTCVLLSVSSYAAQNDPYADGSKGRKDVYLTKGPVTANIFYDWYTTDDNGNSGYSTFRASIAESVRKNMEARYTKLQDKTGKDLVTSWNAGGYDTKTRIGFSLELNGFGGPRPISDDLDDDVSLLHKIGGDREDREHGMSYEVGFSGNLRSGKYTYLNYSVNGVTYALYLPNDKGKENLSVIVRDIRIQFYKALAESLIDYTYVIYTFNDSGVQFSDLSTLNTSNLRPLYVISPVFGAIPWNTEWHGWSDFLKSIYTYATYDTSSMNGEIQLDDSEIHYKDYIHWLVSETGIDKDKGLAFFKQSHTNYFQGFWLTTKDDEGWEDYPIVGFFVHPDWIAFSSSINRPGVVTGLVELTGDKKPSQLFASQTFAGSSTSATERAFLSYMMPIAYVDSWKTLKDTSSNGASAYNLGVYTASWKSVQDTTSTLTSLRYSYGVALSGSTGLTDLKDSRTFRLSYLNSYLLGNNVIYYNNNLGISTNDDGTIISYSDADYGEQLVDGLEIKIGCNIFSTKYYYNVSDNCVYRPSRTLNIKGYSTSLSARGYLGTFEKEPDLMLDNNCKLVRVKAIPPFNNVSMYYIGEGLEYNKDPETEFINSQSSIGTTAYSQTEDIIELNSDNNFVLDDKVAPELLVVVPTVYTECYRDTVKERSTDITDGSITTKSIVFYVPLGRHVAFDFNNYLSMDMLNANGTLAYKEGGTYASGAYYNTKGRILSSDNKNIYMNCIMLKDGPAIIINPAYIEESGLMTWLDTAEASAYLASNVKATGYTANFLRSRLMSDGAKMSDVTAVDDLTRLEEIADELEGNKEINILDVALTLIGFVGILLMVYACLLVITFYIDLFNGITSWSLLGLITLGKLKAIQSKNDLDDLGITDPKERRKYVTRASIIVRWAIAMGFGLLLFASNQIYVWVMSLFTWISQMLGLS